LIVVILFDFVVMFPPDRDKSLDALRAVGKSFAMKAMRIFTRIATGATAGAVCYSQQFNK
jgi:hypothetical protein